MFCSKCGAQIAQGVNFCMKCGQAATTAVQEPPAPVASAPAPPTPPTNFEPFSDQTTFSAGAYDFNPFNQEPQTPPRKMPIKWIGVGAGFVVALVVAVGVFAVIDSSRYINPEKSPTLAESLSPLKVEEAAQNICANLEAALPSDDAVQALVSRTAAMNKYNGGNARKALKFRNSATWIDSTQIIDVSAALVTATAGALDDVISKTETIRENDRASFAGLWQDTFISLALESCDLQSKFDSANAAQAGFTTAKGALITLAASVPWYPDGYNQWWQNENVAWKWAKGIGCDLGDSCWHIKVIALTGCPGGVYAELNEMDANGNVIGYSNDLLPSLGAMSTAIMEFSTYNSRSQSGQLTTINCHNY